MKFLTSGYLVIRDVVPKDIRDRALRAINRHLAKPPSEIQVQSYSMHSVLIFHVRVLFLDLSLAVLT